MLPDRSGNVHERNVTRVTQRDITGDPGGAAQPQQTRGAQPKRTLSAKAKFTGRAKMRTPGRRSLT